MMRDSHAGDMLKACAVVALGLLAGTASCQKPGRPQQQALNPGQFGPGKEGLLTELPLPAPEQFRTKDGRTGWKVKIPGGRPLATPAVADGVLYVGGGFGSHEFYALDARTGTRVWTFKTGDDGPTAAVVSDGCVAYNTESCTLYVHDAETGEVLWHKWLGDPLMSHPAVAEGRLFMAYPGKDGAHHLVAFELRTGKVFWDRKIVSEVITAPVVDDGSVFAATTDGTLYRFDAGSGEEYWAEKCNVTSAPRIVDGRVLISQRAVRDIEISVGEGEEAKKQTSQVTMEGFNDVDAASGKLAFKEPQAAVRAAYLLSLDKGRADLNANDMNAQLGQQAYRYMAIQTGGHIDNSDGWELAQFKNRLDKLAKKEASEDSAGALRDAEEAMELAEEVEKASVRAKSKKSEQALRRAAKEMKDLAGKTREAALMAGEINGDLPAMEAEARAGETLDASVGFASAPASAKVQLAASNIGVRNVKAIWAYQGSRPCLFGETCVSVHGDLIRAVDGRAGKVLWESRVESKTKATRPATPPALAGGKLYLGTADGRILCVDPSTGRTAWETKVGGNILFQPAVVGGRVYAATNDGVLVCLETGDAAADGWSMWGGSARHNGPQEE